MKTNTTTLVLSISLIAIAGMFTASVSGLIGHDSKTDNLGANAMFTGHVITTVTDADGNVKAYRQSDNVVTNTGETCAARLLFNLENSGVTTTTADVCKGALTQSFTTIALGTGGGTGANGTQRSLTTETTASGLARSATDFAKTVTFTNATTGGPSSGSFASTDSAKVVIAKEFVNNSGGSVNISESGLFNSTSGATSGMFARQTFSDIAVGSGDHLTVQWTINIGATSKFLS